ncbi:unnamed protein product [Paramecium pentaurelia]|uniref:Vacuolar sorting receptor thioredoxin-like domain-containing protein n=1 Tax=Paramecium pentaurelia TaxID=43138 RepID=A0A8S1XN18_9CILI|nr:unnamed protein product [Paramecium pentaurelia]
MLFFILISLVQSIDVRQNVNLTIGLDFMDNSHLPFFEQFQSYFLDFKQKGLNLIIAQHLLPCYSCFTRHQYKQPESNCFGGGQYCQFSESVSGQTILTEMLRQQCILEEEPQYYFNYTIYFSQQCMQLPSEMKSCSENYFLNNNISTQSIDNCIENSFEGQSDQFQSLKTNRILDQYKQLQYNKTKFALNLDDQDLTNTPFKQIMNQLCKKFEYASIPACGVIKADSIQKTNLLEKIFLVLFAIIICLIIVQGTLSLFQNLQFKTFFSPKSRITIPKLEKDHIIQDDDV